ncbi:M15 family metallopeptidase [Mycobacterium sp.]|uniref:M15 family metallopeptidase n=1 Tax=Mycobacterium sp. TaxID=1785 RepID=UPI002C649CD2|nr:M15 family metallopeptidase [Mycobacterium sp.]HKP40422.1 M15 family metallopeptidase [Mycobacterium sp.]
MSVPRHAAIGVHFAHVRRRISALVAATALVSGCATAVPIEPVSTTQSVAPTPDAQLSIGPAATDTFGGWIPEGQTLSPFDVSNPVLAQLDPALLQAIQDATRKAASEGIDIRITSGWRSPGFQQRLFDDAVAKFGSVDVARQFVAAPEVSKHVLGQAVDVAPVDADQWLIRNGVQFGLCQIYANEIWHFELAVDEHGNCPPLKPNAAG